jgi:hypothetical protein
LVEKNRQHVLHAIRYATRFNIITHNIPKVAPTTGC